MSSVYEQLGVVAAEKMASFGSALDILRRTFAYPRAGRPVLDFGYYANVLDIGNNLGLAISTDGVGTKLLVAQQMGRFDTVGIDCVAMNANDVVSVGAEPIAMVDYIAVEATGSDQLKQLALGLAEGARRAGISVPGGEVAQVPEMLHRTATGDGFDLVGTCVGLVPLDRVLVGRHVEPGDALVGFASSGIHSNGLTLARAVFAAAEWKLSDHVPEFGRTVGEELLEPTAMYVRLGLELIGKTGLKALAHITGDGLLNLSRMVAPVGFDIDFVPDPPAVFEVIRRLGSITAEEMYSVFNMGVGFCAVVPEEEVEAALELAVKQGLKGWRLGTATDSAARVIRLAGQGVESRSGKFVATSL